MANTAGDVGIVASDDSSTVRQAKWSAFDQIPNEEATDYQIRVIAKDAQDNIDTLDMAAAIDSGSAGSKYCAASPATSGNAPVSLQITGQSCAIASNNGRPKPSSCEG